MADHQQPSKSDCHQDPQEQQQRKRKYVVLLGTLLVVVFNLSLFRSTASSFTSTESISKATSVNNGNSTATATATVTGSEPSLHKNEDPQEQQITRPSPETQVWKRQLQESSMSALERMKDREALVSPYSTRESAITHGFPSQWNSCTIHSLLEEKQKRTTSNQTEAQTLRVMILGGSCSARAAENCADETGIAITGRWSNILQRIMDEDSHHFSQNVAIKFDFVNLAQGSTNSVLNGLTMDTLVDPTQADILIWEFSPNESWGYKTKDSTKTQFWLARVQSLFQAASKPLPPVLMIYLWQRNIGLPNRVHEIVEPGLNVSVASALPTIEYHKQSPNKWNIQAISVGSAVANSSALAANPKLLIDDEIHPGCHSVHMIADMIQHAIHTNLATCGVEAGGKGGIGNSSDAHVSVISNVVAVEPEEPPLPKLGGYPKLADLWKSLINPNVRIGSFTPWEPQAGGLTKLSIDKDSLTHNWRLINTEKSNEWRGDRKRGYWLPLCPPKGTEVNVTATGNATVFASQTNEVGTIQITFLEPKLEWLGIGITRNGEIRGFLNGVEVDVAPDTQYEGRLGMQHIKQWIKVADYSRKRDSHTLALCAVPEARKAWLRQVVGVMEPEEATQSTSKLTRS